MHGDPTPDDVLEADLGIAWHFQADHMLIAPCQPFLRLRRAQGEAVLHVLTRHGVVCRCRDACGLQALPHGLQVLRCVESVIGLVVLYQLVSVLPVQVLAIALAIRAVGATVPGPFIGLHAAPLQGLADVIFGPGNEPCLVRVLDAQQELATVLACEEVVVKGGAHTTHVQWPGGTWGEADSYGHAICADPDVGQDGPTEQPLR